MLCCAFHELNFETRSDPEKANEAAAPAASILPAEQRTGAVSDRRRPPEAPSGSPCLLVRGGGFLDVPRRNGTRFVISRFRYISSLY